MEKERLTTEMIFDGSESVVPLADVVYIEKRNDDSKLAGSLAVILRGTTWNYEAGCHNNAAYVPKDEADAFLEAWARYRSEVDRVQTGPGEAPAPSPDPVAFQKATEMAFGHAAHVHVSFHNAGTKIEHVDGLASQALLLLPGAHLEHQRGETAWWTLVERGDVRFVVYGNGSIPDGWGKSEKKEEAEKA